MREKYKNHANLNIFVTNINKHITKAYTKNEKWEFVNFKKIIIPIIIKDFR